MYHHSNSLHTLAAHKNITKWFGADLCATCVSSATRDEHLSPPLTINGGGRFSQLHQLPEAKHTRLCCVLAVTAKQHVGI